MPDPSLHKMNMIISGAVNMCTGIYLSMGFFGYIAFSHLENIDGNILVSFAPTMAIEALKLGFVLTVALSFPMVLFPCRQSIYSLMFREVS